MRVKRVWNLTLWALLLLLAAAICFPVWMALTGAFSSQWELETCLAPVFAGEEGMAAWHLLPLAPTLRHLVEVLLDSPGFFAMFWNSVSVSVATLAGQLALAVPAAWALAQLPLPGKQGLLGLYIVLMLMPFQVLMFPQYLVLDQMKLLDTLGAVILPGIFSAFPVFLMYRFFCAIPQELLEAARLDGAGEWRIFWQIGLPLATPGVVAVGILSFLDSWNLIEQPMTYLKDKQLWPLSLFLPQIGLEEMGMGFAAALLMLIPALLLFLSCQEDLQQGIALSGGKE